MAENPHNYMRLRGARTNNLKNISVDFPLKKLTVVTGLSGSGKSSLVFDTLYAEGQRRYTESLSTYIRQFLGKIPRPDIDSLENISPAIALEQKNHINNSRATVATMSELYDYLRILFSKLGQTFCVKCGELVKKDTPSSISLWVKTLPAASRFYVSAPLMRNYKTQKDWLTHRAELIATGYQRILFEDELYELPELEKFPSKKKTVEFSVVIDRLSKPDSAEKDSRLLEALEQALLLGAGKCTVSVVEGEKKKLKHKAFSSKFRCDECALDYKEPEPQLLSFNSPLGACTFCNGFGYTLELSEKIVVPDPKKSIAQGAVDPFNKPASEDMQTELLAFCKKQSISLTKRYEDLSKEEKELVWNGDPEKSKKNYGGVVGFFEMLKSYKYKMHVRIFIRRYQDQVLCPSCKGVRLRPEALAVKVGNTNIAEVLNMTIENAKIWIDGLKLTAFQKEAGKEIFEQVKERLFFMNEVGVGYLTLNRLGKTLSGGECQRVYLASQLGNKLCSTLYVLDEPSIGLHAADTEKLIGLLHRLRDHGNTVVLVEHDLEMIKASDYMVELGPKAGYMGGDLVVQGELKDLLKYEKSITAGYLSKRLSIPAPQKIRGPSDKILKITGAAEHNLKNLIVEIPLKRLVAVTGPSGSGKTTLIHRKLYNALFRLIHRENVEVGKFQRIYGSDLINDVVMLDQRPIGKSSRSNPATYLKIYDDIRKIYSNQSLSLKRGYTPQYFSFNVDGGRCETCKGEGEVAIDMHFMAELKLPCEDCQGLRFKKNILDVEFKKKNIAQLLATTIDECIDLFREYLPVSKKLQILKRVGLGYLQLGQSGTTLSGGESQRLKIASVLCDSSSQNVLYIFDEPTTGLHVDDVKRLISVLQDLVDNGNTVLVIEHNLELISQVDHIIDIGPEAGERGGEVVCTGTPDEVMNNSQSITGKFLKKMRKNQ